MFLVRCAVVIATVGAATVPPIVMPGLVAAADTVLTPVTAPATPLKLRTPALVRVTVPPSATEPPPDRPVPGETVSELFASIALVTPAVGIEIVPEVVIGPPVRPAPVLT